MKTKYYLLLLLLGFSLPVPAQQEDTAALIKEFKKIADFAAQPYLYYSIHTSMQSAPVLTGSDTASTEGEFYKNQTDFYFRNGQEEIYLEDSLLIRVDHAKKSVWVSRVDQASKEKANGLLPGNKQLQEMMRKRYSIHKEVGQNGLTSLQFTSKQVTGMSGVISTRILLSYSASNHLPQALEVEMRMQQPADENIAAQIRSQGADERKLLQQVDGKLYLVRSQKISTWFISIDRSKEKAMQIPVWQNILSFDAASKSFSTRAGLEEYAVTKTF
jgi:hypothetical protein